MNKFKDLLANRRKELKMTQRELAEKLNVSDKTISKWETGASYPEITMIAKISKVLEISINDLFGVDDIKNDEIIEKEPEAYNYEVITKYKNKMFIIIGTIISSLIILLSTIVIDDSNLQVIIGVLGFAIYCFGFIYFINSNLNFRSFYKTKFYIREYDYTYFKYSFLLIFIFSLPFVVSTIVISASINFFTIAGIVNLVSLLLVIASFYGIHVIKKLSNFITKKDSFNLIALVVAIIIFLGIITGLIPYLLIPIVYLLIYIRLMRCDYFSPNE